MTRWYRMPATACCSPLTTLLNVSLEFACLSCCATAHLPSSTMCKSLTCSIGTNVPTGWPPASHPSETLITKFEFCLSLFCCVQKGFCLRAVSFVGEAGGAGLFLSLPLPEWQRPTVVQCFKFIIEVSWRRVLPCYQGLGLCFGLGM
jgi:hypothetical protein